MLFSAYEMLTILLTVASRNELNERGIGLRTQSRILRDPNYPCNDLMALMTLLVEYDLLPFHKFWLAPLAKIYALEESGDISTIEREYAAFFVMARTVIDAKLAATEPDVRRGALLFAAKYLASFNKAKGTVFAKARADALDGSSVYYQMLIDEMRRMRDLCSTLIKGKSAANIVVNRWNAVTPAERTNAIMRDYIRRSGYLTWAAKQMETWPKNYKPAFNALAVASAHRRRHYYPVLYKALLRTSVEFTEFSEYHDDDFLDFRNWLSETDGVDASAPTDESPPTSVAVRQKVM